MSQILSDVVSNLSISFLSAAATVCLAILMPCVVVLLFCRCCVPERLRNAFGDWVVHVLRRGPTHSPPVPVRNLLSSVDSTGSLVHPNTTYIPVTTHTESKRSSNSVEQNEHKTPSLVTSVPAAVQAVVSDVSASTFTEKLVITSALAACAAFVYGNLYRHVRRQRDKESATRALFSTVHLVAAAVFVACGGIAFMKAWKTISSYISVLYSVVHMWSWFARDTTSKEVAEAVDQSKDVLSKVCISMEEETKDRVKEALCSCVPFSYAGVHHHGMVTVASMPVSGDALTNFTSIINQWPEKLFFKPEQKFADLADSLGIRIADLAALSRITTSGSINVVLDWPGLPSVNVVVHGVTKRSTIGEIVESIIGLAADREANIAKWLSSSAYVLMRRNLREAYLDAKGRGDITETGVRASLPDEKTWRERLRGRLPDAFTVQSLRSKAFDPLPTRETDPFFVKYLADLGPLPVLAILVFATAAIYLGLKEYHKTHSDSDSEIPKQKRLRRRKLKESPRPDKDDRLYDPHEPAKDFIIGSKAARKPRSQKTQEKKEKEGFWGQLLHGEQDWPTSGVADKKGCVHVVTCPLFGTEHKITSAWNLVCDTQCGGHNCTHFAGCRPLHRPDKRYHTGLAHEEPYDDGTGHLKWRPKKEALSDVAAKRPVAGRVCLHIICGRSCPNPQCTLNHAASTEDIQKIRTHMAKNPCRRGADCRTAGCPYKHPIDEGKTKESILGFEQFKSRVPMKHTFIWFRGGRPFEHFLHVQNELVSPAHAFANVRPDQIASWQKHTKPFIHTDVFDFKSLDGKIEFHDCKLNWHVYPLHDFAWAKYPNPMIGGAVVQSITHPVPAFMVMAQNDSKWDEINYKFSMTKGHPLDPAGLHDAGTVVGDCGSGLWSPDGKCYAMHFEGGVKGRTQNAAIMLGPWKPSLGVPWKDGAPDPKVTLPVA